jgi:hypothetical protein
MKNRLLATKATKSTKSTKSAPAEHVPAGAPPSEASNLIGGASPATSPATSVSTAPPSPAPPSFTARIAAAVDHITQAKALLGFDSGMSAAEIRRAVKFRKGGEQHLPTLAGLSAKYGVEVPARPTADMTAALERATQLDPARTAIGELSKIVDDAYFGSRSESWTTATALYSMLKRGSASDPGLASALSPLQDYFARRHPLVAAEHPKRAPEKALTKEQQKVAKRVAKLQTQIAKLQAVAPAADLPAGETAPAQPGAAAGAAPVASTTNAR